MHQNPKDLIPNTKPNNMNKLKINSEFMYQDLTSAEPDVRSMLPEMIPQPEQQRKNYKLQNTGGSFNDKVSFKDTQTAETDNMDLSSRLDFEDLGKT